MKPIKIETSPVNTKRPNTAPRFDALEGSPIVVTSEPTWKPRLARDYECIWDDSGDSGNIYKCFYVSTQSAWYYVTITAIP